MKPYLFGLGDYIDKFWEHEEQTKSDADHVRKLEGKKREFTKQEGAPQEPYTQISDTVGPRITESSVVVNDKLYGACIRKIYLRIKNIAKAKPTTSYSLRNFELGNHLENLDQDLMHRAGILVRHNGKFETINPLCSEQYLKGEFDSLIKLPDPEIVKSFGLNITPLDDNEINGDIHVIVEHKSSYGYSFERDVLGTKTIRGNPRTSYILQLALYLDLAGKTMNIPNIVYGKLYYTSRGNSAHKEFDIVLVGKDKEIYIAEHPSRNVWQNFVPTFVPYMGIKMKDVYSRYKIFSDYLKNEIIPPMDYMPIYDSATIAEKHNNKEITKAKYELSQKTNIGDIECSYCSYSEFCLNELKDKQIITKKKVK